MLWKLAEIMHYYFHINLWKWKITSDPVHTILNALVDSIGTVVPFSSVVRINNYMYFFLVFKCHNKKNIPSRNMLLIENVFFFFISEIRMY